MAEERDRVKERLRDLDREVPRHRKKKGEKKPFVIERRMMELPASAGSPALVKLWWRMMSWHKFKGYVTARQAQQALAALNSKTHVFGARWEYRLKENLDD